jgi:hypothetical protein
VPMRGAGLPPVMGSARPSLRLTDHPPISNPRLAVLDQPQPATALVCGTPRYLTAEEWIDGTTNENFGTLGESLEGDSCDPRTPQVGDRTGRDQCWPAWEPR